jgi:hypothetical protein
MIKVAQEGQVAKEEKGVQDIRAETNHHARKFYAQRNCEFVELGLIPPGQDRISSGKR